MSLTAQENINLTIADINPAPLAPIEQAGAGCYNFSILNADGGYDAGDLSITILHFNIMPPSGVADISSSAGASSVWNWSYDAASNTYTGDLIAPIAGFLYTEIITVCFDVITNSTCPIENAGFEATANILGGAANGSDLDDVAAAFTCTDLTLPVTYSYFEAIKDNGTSKLQWATTAEINNAGFEILRSRDGVNFDKIGEVEGNGTTQERSDYTFTDSNPKSGVNYYQLAQIDYDGTINKSYVKNLTFETLRNLSFGPNPTNNSIRFNSSEINQIRIFDTTGRLVLENRLSSNLELSVANLNNGMYIIEAFDIDKIKIGSNTLIVNK